MKQRNKLLDGIRQDCWDEAVRNSGTSYIFEKRAKKYQDRSRFLDFLGLAVPILIGAIYTSFSTSEKWLEVLITIGGIIGAVQLVATVWSMVAHWEQSANDSWIAMTVNRNLAGRFERLAKHPPETLDDLKRLFDLLETENRLQSDQDDKQGITDKERRMGMRHALRKYRRACAGCKQTPLSMKETDCDVCGNFGSLEDPPIKRLKSRLNFLGA